MATYDYDKIPPGLAQLPKTIGLMGGAVLLLVLVFSSFQTIHPGERGVVFSQLSGVKAVQLGEGIHFKIPFVETIIPVDVKVQKLQTESRSSSRDLQTVSVIVAVNYRIDPANVQKLYQNVGVDYRERIIDPATQEAIKATTAHYTAEELITRRNEVKDTVTVTLTERLARFNIQLEEFSIVNFEFSQEFNTAIELKQTAEQNALKAKRDLDRIKIEAEQKLTMARGESEAQSLQRATLTAEVLQLRAIEKWNGVLPQMTGGAMPFIDINNLRGK